MTLKKIFSKTFVNIKLRKIFFSKKLTFSFAFFFSVGNSTKEIVKLFEIYFFIFFNFFQFFFFISIQFQFFNFISIHFKFFKITGKNFNFRLHFVFFISFLFFFLKNNFFSVNNMKCQMIEWKKLNVNRIFLNILL